LPNAGVRTEATIIDPIEVTALSVRRNDAEFRYEPVMQKRLRAWGVCIPRRSHLYRAKFILQLSVNRRTIVSQNPAMMPILF
jgi:hypothetical protein